MAEHTALIVPLKSIAVFPGWTDSESETGYVWFDAPLDIGGVTEPGFVLHGGCYINRPDVHVTLELRISKSLGRRTRPLERIDWRSLSGGHSNATRKGLPKEVSGRRVSCTHLHAFELNYLYSECRMRAHDLPYAAEIDEDLDSFESLLKYAGKRFRINNIHVVSPPSWEYNLLDGGPA